MTVSYDRTVLLAQLNGDMHLRSRALERLSYWCHLPPAKDTRDGYGEGWRLLATLHDNQSAAQKLVEIRGVRRVLDTRAPYENNSVLQHTAAAFLLLETRKVIAVGSRIRALYCCTLHAKPTSFHPSNSHVCRLPLASCTKRIKRHTGVGESPLNPLEETGMR